MKKTLLLKNLNIEKIPSSPGIYFFIGPKSEVLYAGKAANLKERLRSYFSIFVSEKVGRLLKESKKLKVLALESEIDALIKEARFIKKNRPKYNVLLRDDKNYFYVGFTKETFPRIFLTHQPTKVRSSKFDPSTSSGSSRAKSRDEIRNSEFLGPYVSGRALKETLRLARRVFPYCTCKKTHRRVCLQKQLGLCPGYCCQIGRNTSGREKREYAAHISSIKKVLTGKHRILQKGLDSALHSHSQQKRFEESAKIRDQILGLKRVVEHRGLIQTFEVKEPQEAVIAVSKLQKVLGMPKFPTRIECYDASEISGKYAVGAMTVFINGEPQKSGWRLFKMKRVGDKGDPAHIEEILNRRRSHREWPVPNLIIIDGGIAQLAAARRTLGNTHPALSIIGIVKGKERGKNDRLIWDYGKNVKLFRALSPDTAKLLAYIRNETHRFAISFHRKLRRKSFTKS